MARRKQKSKLHYALLAGFLIPACSGGGCSSCSGVTPLPGGFANDARVENAASVRITQKGFDFLESNIGSIASQVIGGGSDGLTFGIPETSGTALSIFNYTICPGGPTTNPLKCNVEIDLANAQLAVTSEAAHQIKINGNLPLRLQDLPIDTSAGGTHLTLSGNQSCPGNNSTYALIPVTAIISVETDLDSAHARYGYSRIRVNSVTADKAQLESSVKFCGGLLSGLLDFFKGYVVNFAYDSLLGTLSSSLEEQLCQKANPDVSPTCPTGTNDVDGICRYGTAADDECVSMVLGTDGHADLSGLLASLSPGTKGGMDFLLAAGGPSQRDDGSGQTWGDLNPIGQGATLSMFGGVEPNPISKCVPQANVPRPTGLAIPNELIDDSLITDWPVGTPGPHVGFGLSESFFNYALAGMYNSGLLCIGLSTESVDLLNSSTLALLAQSLRDLGIQREPQPIAIMLKPQQPPHVTFGAGTGDSDPLIKLEMPQATFDFYILSSDRYIRFMSATFDVTAPVNLTVTPDGLVPTLNKLDIANGKIENSELLREDPAVLAASLQSLLSSQVGALIGSGLPAIDVNGALSGLGLQLVIPETVEGQGSPGLRMVQKNGERYLAIFAALETAQMQSLQTDANIDIVHIDPDGLSGGTITEDNAPSVQINARVLDDHGKPVEHQVSVDGGMWKPWTRRDVFTVQDEAFRLQGRHVVEVRSRNQGDAYSIDKEPVALEVVIDQVAPEVKIGDVTETNTAKLDVFDMVSRDATAVRYKFDDGEFSNWMPIGQLTEVQVPEEAEELTVEAKDESGNVGQAQQAIIRGLPHGAAGGCGCSVPGAQEDASPRSVFALAGLAAIAVLRLRRRKNGKKAEPKKAEPKKAGPKKAARSAKAEKGGLLGRALFGKPGRQAVAAVSVLLIGGSWSGCSCDDDTTPDQNYSCKDPCVTLEPGLIGEYTSAAVATNGDIWVSGYLEANWDQAIQYGDLVAGKWNAETSKVDWEIVDGVPTEPAVDGKSYNLKGFRGGQTAPGDDVGQWTSLAMAPDGQPAIAYYDRTNKALKFAKYSVKGWAIDTVDDSPDNDVGRYAKLVYDGSVATIAFLAEDATADGFPTTRVRLATQASNGFTIEDVATNESTPCRAQLCTGGSKCVDGDGRCAAASAACGTCDAGTECVTLDGTASCQTTLAAGKLDPLPVASGLYISLAKIPGGGLGIAYYDRVEGSLKVAAKEADGWKTVTVDGGPQPDGSYLDAGVGASLFIDDGGDWHLSYVDGYNETLKYAVVEDGAVTSVETVDDGLSVGGVDFPDGLHIVGDDSHIVVNAQGQVMITYQDATNGKLRYATGTKTSTGHDWTTKVVDADNFGGFFSGQLDADGSHKLVHWWRKLGPDADGNLKMTGDVSIVGSP